MLYGAIIITALICFSGLIAYLGDQIGMKVGKKRISLFGLRPKYTSVLITVLTGILIATLTIFSILLINENVRQAVFDIQQVYQEKSELEKQLDYTRKEFSHIENELELTKEEVKEQRQKREELMKENQNLQVRITDLNKNKESLEQEINQKEQEIQGLNKSIEELNNDLEKLQQAYTNAKQGYEFALNRDIVYQIGETIFTGVIKRDDTEEETVKMVEVFLEKALQKAKERSPDFPFVAPIKDYQSEINTLAEKLDSSDSGRLIVKIFSAVNAFEGAPLFIDVSTDEDHIVFEKGELLASKIIKSEEKVDYSFLSELLAQVSNKADTKGLLRDEEGNIGALKPDRSLRYINEVQNIEGDVKVEIYAAKDIWREYALQDKFTSNLEFKIISLEDEQ